MMDLDGRIAAVKFLLRDRDSRFTMAFDAVYAAGGFGYCFAPPQAPRANAICERMIGTLRRELLDRLLDRQRAAPATASSPSARHISTPAERPDGVAPRPRDARSISRRLWRPRIAPTTPATRRCVWRSGEASAQPRVLIMPCPALSGAYQVRSGEAILERYGSVRRPGLPRRRMSFLLPNGKPCRWREAHGPTEPVALQNGFTGPDLVGTTQGWARHDQDSWFVRMLT